MKKFVFSMGACVVMVSSLFAYEEWSLPNLAGPTLIKPLAIEGQFQHQFWGRIDGADKFDRFFGIADGAEGCFTLRTAVWSTAQVLVSYDNIQLFNNSRNEFVVGASYAAAVPWIFLNVQADAQYFSYASMKTSPEKRFNNYFVQVALRNDPLFGRVVALVDGGYDFDRKAYGLGLGLDVKVIDLLDVYGEYFPVLKKTYYDPLNPGRIIRNPYSFGVKFTTPGTSSSYFSAMPTKSGPAI